MLSWKVVVLLIFTNSIFKQQNIELWTVSKYKGFYLLIQSYKRSYTGSAVLEGGRSADIHELFFKLQKVQIWNLSICKGVYSHFQVSKSSDNCSNIRQEFGFTDASYRVLRVQNVEIFAVLSSNEVDFLMLKNYVFIHRNDQKCAVHS